MRKILSASISFGCLSAALLGLLAWGCGDDSDSATQTTSANQGGSAGAAGSDQAGAAGSAQAGSAGAAGSQGPAGASGSGGSQSGSGGSGGGETASEFEIGLRVDFDLSPSLPGVNSSVYASGSKKISEVPPQPSCTKETIDGCVATFCDSIPKGGVVDSQRLSAGDITITGAATSPLTLAPGDKGYSVETTIAEDKPIFLGGELIEVKATGADVGPFTLQLKAPAPAKIEGLPAVAKPTADLDTSHDLTLKMAATEARLVFILNAFSTDEAPVASLVCDAPVDGNPRVIKAATLQKLKKSNAQGTLITLLLSEQTQMVGDVKVTLDAATYLLDPEGKPLAGSIPITFK